MGINDTPSQVKKNSGEILARHECGSLSNLIFDMMYLWFEFWVLWRSSWLHLLTHLHVVTRPTTLTHGLSQKSPFLPSSPKRTQRHEDSTGQHTGQQSAKGDRRSRAKRLMARSSRSKRSPSTRLRARSRSDHTRSRGRRERSYPQSRSRSEHSRSLRRRRRSRSRGKISSPRNISQDASRTYVGLQHNLVRRGAINSAAASSRLLRKHIQRVSYQQRLGKAI